MTIKRRVNPYNHDLVYTSTDCFADNSNETVLVMASADQVAGAPERNWAQIVLSSSRVGGEVVIATLRNPQSIRDLIAVLQTALTDTTHMPTSDEWRQMWDLEGRPASEYDEAGFDETDEGDETATVEESCDDPINTVVPDGYSGSVLHCTLVKGHNGNHMWVSFGLSGPSRVGQTVYEWSDEDYYPSLVSG